MQLSLWKDLLWDQEQTYPRARCPEHRVVFEVHDRNGDVFSQKLHELGYSYLPHTLVCPVDEKRFEIPVDSLITFRKRFSASMEAINWKDAKVVSVDGYQIPIAKTKVIKSSDYWVKAQINDTKQGKQLVVYAGKRGADDKTQIFIDTENDKISFDQNNIHPSDIFVRLTGEFASGKKTVMEDGGGQENPDEEK